MIKGIKKSCRLYKNLFAYISMLLIIVLGCVTKLIYYVQCDDYQMNLISVGAISGKSDEHLIYIKAIYGYIIKFLNNVIPAINWFGILYLVLILLCTCAIYYILSRHIKWIVALLFAWATEVVSLAWIHFSVIAYLCIAAALLLIAELIINQSSRKILLKIAAFILLNSALILRVDCFVTGFLLGIPVLIGVVLNKEYEKNITLKRIAGYVVVECILLLMIFGVEKYTYSNSLWTTYKEYNDVRSNALDFEISDLDEIKNNTDVAWTENDLNSLRAWIFADKEVYSYENLTKVVESTSLLERYNLNILDVVKNMLKLKETLFVAIAFLFFMIFSKANRKYILLQGIFIFGLIGCLFVLQRALQRIYIGVYLIGLIYLLYLYIIDKKRNKSYKIGQIIFTVAIFCGVIMLLLSYARYSYRTARMLKIREASYQEEREYILDNKDKFFVSYKFFEILQYQSITDVGFDETYENLSCLGSWDMYTESYYKQAKKYQFNDKDRVLMNLVNNDNFYFIAQKDYASFPVVELLTKYLEEHSEKSIKREKIKTFEKSGDILYKFSIN